MKPSEFRFLMQSPKRRRSTKTTKKRQTSKEDAFRLKAEPLLEALDSAIFQIRGGFRSMIFLGYLRGYEE